LQVDDYRIERLLGRGGMAAVYRAEDTVLNRPVALKILPAGPAADPELIARFEREAKIVARLNHPNIAQVYSTGQAMGCPYYAMEYINGSSLAQAIADKGRLSPRRLVDYLIQICKGLRAAAEHGVTHRDIKPGNLMVTADGVVKIVDFGIAKVFRDDTFQTRTGAIVGTPKYMSPEQGKGMAVDRRSDIYSLGATAYHLLVGRPPFEADNSVTLMIHHVQKPVPSIDSENGRVPLRLCNIIYGMMAKDPESRIGDYGELIAAFEKVFEQHEPLGDEAFADRRSPLRLWKTLIGVAAALLILTAVGALTLRAGDNAAPADPSVEHAEPAPRETSSRRPMEADPTLRETVGALRDLRDFRTEMDDEQP
jgi:serine/threonine protein kinase